MIVLLAAIGGLFGGIYVGFIAVLTLLEHFRWKSWIAVVTAAILALPIGILVGVAAAAILITVMYPDFEWKF